MRPGILIVVLGTLLTASCAALAPPQTMQAQRVDRMLEGVLKTRRAAPQAQRRELARARTAFASGHGEIERLRLATLLATLPPPLRDDARAAELLAPLIARAPETPVTRFADMLASQVGELQQRDEALRASTRQAQELQHKLEQLQAIERRSIDRDVHLQ